VAAPAAPATTAWARHDESFDRVHRDLGTELTAIWPDTERVVLGRCIRSGSDGGVSLRCGRTDVAVFSWVLVDLDHGGLDLAVSRDKLEIFDADGYADVRGAVGAQPGKCGLDLRTANTEILEGVVCCSADLHGELHDLGVGSKAGQHVTLTSMLAVRSKKLTCPVRTRPPPFTSFLAGYGDPDATDK